MQQMKVYPVEGRRVRDPATGQVVPSEGLLVPRTSYWVRRLRDGDVELRLSRPKRGQKQGSEG